MGVATRVFAAASLAALVVSAAWAADSQGIWSSAAQMTTERSEIGAIETGNKIYVIGGVAQGREDSPMAQEFDPASGKWRDLPPMPVGASHVGVAAMNGRIYVAGGFTANVHKNPLDQLLEFDIAKNSWRALPKLPRPLGSVGLAATGGRLHVIGGRGPDGKTVANHDVFDPATGRWSAAAPLPVARDHIGIVVMDGKIHVFGGRTNATVDNVGLHDVYDPTADKWQTLAPMPTARSSGAYTVYRGMILYHGGECMDAKARITFDQNEAYDPKTDRWMTMAKAPTGLHAHAAAVVGNSAYFIGGTEGCGGDRPSKTVYAFKLP